MATGGCRCALVGVPWRGSVSARLAWSDLVSFNMSKVLKMLSILRRQGTPMRAHLQVPDWCVCVTDPSSTVQHIIRHMIVQVCSHACAAARARARRVAAQGRSRPQYGRFPKFHRVFLGRDPGTLKSDIVSKKHPQLICSDSRLSN